MISGSSAGSSAATPDAPFALYAATIAAM